MMWGSTERRSRSVLRGDWQGGDEWKFDQFIEEGGEDIESNVERFDHFFKASKVSDELKVLVFITAIGKKAYKTLKTLLELEKPERKTHTQLAQTLREQYVPKPSVIAERLKCNRRFQQEGETAAAFAIELKWLAASCDFGTFLDEALRDRFVAGLCYEETQAELPKESKLTFKTACDIARNIDLARKESQEFQPNVRQGIVSVLHRKQDAGKRSPRSREETATVPGGARATKSLDCFRCGSEHKASTRKFRKYHCRLCNRVGHLSKMCRDRSTDSANAMADDSDMGELVLHNTYSCEKCTKPYEISLKIKQKNVRIEIDTGASVSVVLEALYKKYWLTLPKEPCSLNLKTYEGTQLPVTGKLTISHIVGTRMDNKVFAIHVVSYNLLGFGHRIYHALP
ncbi:uncharacterized protein LOC144118961 [Amblyomma americanum]